MEVAIIWLLCPVMAWVAWKLVVAGRKRRVLRQLRKLNRAAMRATVSGDENARRAAQRALRHARRYWGAGSAACAYPKYLLGVQTDARSDIEGAIRHWESALDGVAGERNRALRLDIEHRLAWCHLELGALDTAESYLDDVDREERSDGGFVATTAVCRARIARARGDLESAERLLRTWLEKRGSASIAPDAYRSPPHAPVRLPRDGDGPEYATVCRDLARTLDEQDRHEEARRWCVVGLLATDATQRSSRFACESALAAQAEENWAEALEHWSNLLQADDAHLRASALQGSGYCHERLQAPRRGIESYEQALEQDIENISSEAGRWVRYRLAELYARDDPARALEHFAKSGIGRDELDEFDVCALADAEWLEGNHADATQWIDAHAAALAKPGNKNASLELSLLGQWCALHRRLDRAEECARTALDQSSSARHPRAERELASLRATLASFRAEFDESERYIEELEPDFDDPLRQLWIPASLGQLALARGDPARAATLFSSAIDASPPEPVAVEWRVHVLAGLAHALYATEDVAAARARLGELASLLDEAIPHFSHVRALATASMSELTEASDVERFGMMKQAVGLYERLFGWAPALRVRQAALYARLGRPDDAASAASRALSDARDVLGSSHPLLREAERLQADPGASAP